MTADVPAFRASAFINGKNLYLSMLMQSTANGRAAWMELSPSKDLMWKIDSENSQNHRVSRAISWLNGNFEQPLRIDSLAREASR